MGKEQLRPDDLKRAYPPMPDAFERNVRRTLLKLQCNKEEPVVKKKLSVGLAVTLILILALGAALAVAAQMGLSDFIGLHYHQALPDAAKEAITTDPLGGPIDLGDVTITVNEAIADGRWFYLTASVVPKDPEHSLLFPNSGSFDDPAHACDANWDHKDKRTYPELAKDEGRQIIFYGVWAEYDNQEEMMMDDVRQPDGTMMTITGGGLVTQEAATTVSLRLRTYHMDEKGERVEGTLQEKIIPLTLAVKPAFAEKTFDATGAMVGVLPMALDSVVLTQTPLAMYADVKWHKTEESFDGSRFSFEFLDKEGKEIPLGTTLSGGSLDLAAFPDSITLRIRDFETGFTSVPITLPTK